MCLEIDTEGPPDPCRDMSHWYILFLLLSSLKEIFCFKWRLIDDVVGLSITAAAGERILTHLSCMSLVSLLKEAVSKTCLLKIGQYHLALLNSPQGEACEHLFEDLLAYLGLISMERSQENPIGLLFYGLVYQGLYLPHFGDIFCSTYIFRKFMMSSIS